MPADPPALLNAVGKVCQFGLYVGVLIFLVRRNKRADMTLDLTALSLVILLAAPFTWRHYYVLMLLPLMFVWFNIHHFSRRLTLGVFLSSLLIAGTRYPDFLQTHLSNGPLRVLLVSLLPLSAIALLAVLVFAYRNQGELHETVPAS